MNRAKVVWFNECKGYGFLRDDQNRDVFVHYSQLQDAGYKVLHENEEVEFDLYENEKGLEARNVRKVV